MRIAELKIKNYKSFTDLQSIVFHTSHSLLVGKNNAGKSNILSALEILLGKKNPNYIKLVEDDFFDTSKPIEIKIVLRGITATDKNELFNLPNLTKQQRGALSSKNPDDIEIVFSFQHHFQDGIEETTTTEEIEEAESTEQQRQFEIKLWGFTIHRKIEDVRFALTRMIKVSAIRDASDELSGSRWTYNRTFR